MGELSLLGMLILFLTGLITWQGFKKEAYMQQYAFNVDGILRHKEYFRIISSGFLHVNWLHFGFNMVAFLSFSSSLETFFGPLKIVLVYFLSLIGGSLLSLYIHRNHGDYRAVGASGAVSGVIMTSMVLFPYNEVGLILIPIPFKAWVLGLIFVVISIYGIKAKLGNIGHAAHLGGAFVGILSAFLVDFQMAMENWWIVALAGVPIIVFLGMVINNPAILFVDGYWGFDGIKMPKMPKRKKTSGARATDLNVFKPEESESELNKLLEKIRWDGLDSLTPKERKRLDELKDKL